MKKIFTLSLLTLTAISLTACANTGANTTKNKTNESSKVSKKNSKMNKVNSIKNLKTTKDVYYDVMKDQFKLLSVGKLNDIKIGDLTVSNIEYKVLTINNLANDPTLPTDYSIPDDVTPTLNGSVAFLVINSQIKNNGSGLLQLNGGLLDSKNQFYITPKNEQISIDSSNYANSTSSNPINPGSHKKTQDILFLDSGKSFKELKAKIKGNYSFTTAETMNDSYEVVSEGIPFKINIK